MHNAPNRVYIVALNEAENKQIHIKTISLAARRSGAQSPQDIPAVNGGTSKAQKDRNSEQEVQSRQTTTKNETNEKRVARPNVLDEETGTTKSNNPKMAYNPSRH